MTESEMIARLTQALVDAAGAGARLVSNTATLLRRAEIAAIEVHTERKTRTLMFLGAEALDANGDRIATASSVHRLDG